MTNQIFIQARIGSTRFPRKILKKIYNKTLLEILLERLQNVKKIEKILLITGNSEKNEHLVAEAKRLNLEYFCGNENNILDRFYQAGKKFNSENIIRITGDNLLIDYEIVNQGLDIFLEKKFDILSNNRIRTYPLGLNFEIFTKNALERSWMENLEKFKNEEEFFKTFIPPTKYMLENENFNNYDLINETDYSSIRLTIDYSEDFEVVTKIFESLYNKNKNFTLNEIIQFLKNHPNLLKLNKNLNTEETN